jgi:hypothetical protein
VPNSALSAWCAFLLHHSPQRWPSAIPLALREHCSKVMQCSLTRKPPLQSGAAPTQVLVLPLWGVPDVELIQLSFCDCTWYSGEHMACVITWLTWTAQSGCFSYPWVQKSSELWRNWLEVTELLDLMDDLQILLHCISFSTMLLAFLYILGLYVVCWACEQWSQQK